MSEGLKGGHNTYMTPTPMGATAEFTAPGRTMADMQREGGALVPYVAPEAPAANSGMTPAEHQARLRQNEADGVRAMGATAEFTAPGRTMADMQREGGALVPRPRGNTIDAAPGSFEWFDTPKADANGKGYDGLALSDMTNKEFREYLQRTTGATDDQMDRALRQRSASLFEAQPAPAVDENGLEAAIDRAAASRRAAQSAPAEKSATSTTADAHREAVLRDLNGGKSAEASVSEQRAKGGAVERDAAALRARKEEIARIMATPEDQLAPHELQYRRWLEAREKAAAAKREVPLDREGLKAQAQRLKEAREEIEDRERRLEEARTSKEVPVVLPTKSKAEKAGKPETKPPVASPKAKAGKAKAPASKKEAGVSKEIAKQQELFSGMTEALRGSKGVSKKDKKAFKDLRERYTRIAATRDAVTTLTLNGKDKDNKGNTKKLMETAREELRDARLQIRDAKNKALKKAGYSKKEREAYLHADDVRFAIKTSEKITNKEIANWEDKLPAGSKRRAFVEKWRSWGGRNEVTNADGTQTREKYFSGRRVKGFFAKLGIIGGTAAVAGTVAALAGVPSLVIGGVLGGGAYATRNKLDQVADRVDHANARHAAFVEQFRTDPNLQAAGKGFADMALNRLSGNVNRTVKVNRVKQNLGTVAAAGIGVAGADILQHVFGGHTTTVHHGPKHVPQPAEGGKQYYHHGTTNTHNYPWTVAHNMNRIDGLHTNEMTDIRHVIHSLNGKGNHYGLIPTQNGKFVQLAWNGHSATGAQVAEFNRQLIDYMNTIKG